jgi:electron-transferring-flavoprotein dehydrogenase
MQSGIHAARAIYKDALGEYDAAVNGSYVVSDMRRTRNMRLAFRHGFVLGGIQAALMTLTRGLFPGWRYKMEADAHVSRRFSPGLRPGSDEAPDGKLIFSKVDAVFKAGNATRDTIPSHLIAGPEVPAAVAHFYSHVCPAGVYEAGEGGLRINAPNCVDCKATDVLGPRWTPREGGSGPKYKRM